MPETLNTENEEQQEKFSIFNNKDKYILICSKLNESLILKLKKDSVTRNYYEANLNKNSLLKLSNLFSFCEDINDFYHLLIEHLNKNGNDLKIDFIDNYSVKLLFFLELPTRKKDYINIIMTKKNNKIDVNESLEELQSKIDSIQRNQNKLEKEMNEKLEEINVIIDKQNFLEKELKSKIDEIEEMKSFQSKIEKIYKENEEKINKIEKKQEEIMLQIENIKIEEKNFEKNKDGNEIKDIIKYFPGLNKKIELLKKKQDELQNILNNKDKEIDKLSTNILNCQNSIGEVNDKIISIKKNETQLLEEIRDKDKEISLIKLKQAQLEENKDNLKNEDFSEIVMKQIEELIKDNNLMKKKILNNEKKLAFFNESFTKKINEIKDEKINPGDFEFKKTISSDLFSVNFYNNRACIFTSSEDDKIYVAYGVSLILDLECYDVLNDKKFIIIKKLHKDSFDSCRHFFDDSKKRDLLITSSHDNHVKIVNFKKEKSEIILDLNFESVKDAIINTAYLVHETVLVPFSREGIVKFYSMNKDYIGEIEEVGFILGLSKYFLERTKTHYILIANGEGIFVYCIEGFCLYYKFIPSKEIKKEKDEDKKKEEKEKEENGFSEAYIIEKDEKIILVGPCFYYGFLYFWDFINGNLICALQTTSGISDICLWNSKYIFASLNDSMYQFILININNMKIEQKFKREGKEHFGNGIKLLRHEKKGNFLISLSLKGRLDLYILENKETPF